MLKKSILILMILLQLSCFKSNNTTKTEATIVQETEAQEYRWITGNNICFLE